MNTNLFLLIQNILAIKIESNKIYIFIICLLLISNIIMIFYHTINIVNKKKEAKFNTKENFVKLYNTMLNENNSYIAYISLNYDYMVNEFNNEIMKKIKLFSETYLTNKYDGKYIYDIGSFSYLYLFNSKKYKDEIEDLLKGLNEFINTIDVKCNNLYKAGIYELDSFEKDIFNIATDNAKHGFLESIKKNKLYVLTDQKMIDENIMINDIKKINMQNIIDGEFIPYYQFVYDVKKEKFSAVEFLSRWNSSKYGIVSPFYYIDILKKNNLIIEHDYKMLELACKKIIDWNKKGYYDLNIAVNFTRESLLSEEFFERIEELVDNYKIDYKRIVIELTEDSILYDKKTALKTIDKLVKKGYNISIDDFTNGYTSVQDLITYHANRIKMDKTLVNSCKNNERAANLLKALIKFAHSLNLLVVCEGVEDEETSRIVIDAGTDYIQGFYYSKCLDEKDANKFVKNMNNK